MPLFSNSSAEMFGQQPVCVYHLIFPDNGPTTRRLQIPRCYRFFIAGLVYFLRFERIDSLGAYSVPSEDRPFRTIFYNNYRAGRYIKSHISNRLDRNTQLS